MDKPSLVKLPREVADAITEYKDDMLLNNWKGAILKVALEPEKYIKLGSDEAIKEYVTPHTIDTFLQALVNGYEIETSPEDEVRELFEYFYQIGVTYAGPDIRNKICIMFDLLNIKIKGVND